MSSTEQSKTDAFRAKIEQRKAHERQAMNTSIHLIEQDKVDNETLINAVIDSLVSIRFLHCHSFQAIRIDQERYRGVNEDRAMRHSCGYPICAKPLPKDVDYRCLPNVDFAEQSFLDSNSSIPY